MINRNNIFLLIRAMLIVSGIVTLKLLFHKIGVEFITINTLFTGILSANIFLLGFLLTGILSDFKESEKIPGDIATSLLVLHDEVNLFEKYDCELAYGLNRIIQSIGLRLKLWFYRGCTTGDLLDDLRSLNKELSKCEEKVQANYILRLKQELTIIKRLIIRIDTIRDTSFISSGYLIGTIVTIIMCLGLVFSRIDPFGESIFFVGVISFLMIFLLLLIVDLDNPFDYTKKFSAENVSLYPIERFLKITNTVQENSKKRIY